MFAKILSLTFLALVACSSCTHSPVPDSPRTQDVPAVAKLIILDGEGNREGICTAWKASETLIVTAGHCCDPGQGYMLDGDSGVPGSRIVPLVDNDNADICVLHAQMKGAPIRIARTDPAIGARVWVAGFPKGYFMIGDGYWSGRDMTSDNRRCMFSIDAIGGYSGSPVLNAEGEAVSVLVEGYLGASVTFGVNLDQIRLALRKARATPVPDEDEVTGELPKD